MIRIRAPRPLSQVLALAALAPTSASASAAASPPAIPTAAPSHAIVAARHPARGVPSLVWLADGVDAPAGADPVAAARFHLARHRRLYAVSGPDLDAARVRFVHDTGRGGIIVALRQQVGEVELFHDDVKVLLDRAHRLVGVSGAPHRLAGLAPAPAPDARVDALRAALRVVGRDVPSARLRALADPPRGGFHRYDLAPAGDALRFDRPARVKAVYYAAGARPEPAHVVELELREGGRIDAVQLVLSADGARVLARRDLIDHAAFKYRVYADPDGDHRPIDGPSADYSPYPFPAPDVGPSSYVDPVLVTMEGFNVNPDGEADPWLPDGATRTVGNNVDAYIDHRDPSGLVEPAEYRAEVTAPGEFDRAYDPTLEPGHSPAQSMAAIVSLFYTVNWMHDWWYGSGFVEAAGTAQTDNYGRGGVDGDPLLAEAQDGLLEDYRDNATMLTPEDGTSPVMQMFAWRPGKVVVGLTADPPGQDFAVGQAMFGPKKYDVAADLVLVDDGAGDSPTDGCEPPLNDLTGKIALIDRGECQFEQKAQLAEAAGAVGLVFADIIAGQGPYPPGEDHDIPDPTIPAQGLSLADGALLKAALLDGPVAAHMTGATEPEADGTLDNLIVAHEWGHYIHRRLVPCGSVQCGAESEGWGDFLALHTAARAGDDLAGAWAGGVYAYRGIDPTGWFTGRRFAYSVDPAIDPLSLRHISHGEPLPDDAPINANNFTNAEVHNAGEVWCTMMWEAYVALHQAHAGEPFEDVRRAMGDYVVAGMMLAPRDPTFTEQRDAILMAAAQQDPDDFVTLAEAFARRGAGTCAVAPPRTSGDLVGVVEDFELRPNGVVLAATLDDSVASCDQDGVLDADETGRLALQLRNAGAEPMTGATLEILAPDGKLAFTPGATIELPALAPLAETTIDLDVVLADVTPGELVILTARLTTPDGCATSFELPVPAILDGDLEPGAAATDDVEAATSPWTALGEPEDAGVWTRAVSPTTGHVWHAENLSTVSDTFLVSPALAVGDDPLVVSFTHRYSFETSGTGTQNDPFVTFDGGVIELTADSGKTWVDIAELTLDTGYGNQVASPDNPLFPRNAYTHQNPAWPDYDVQTLDLGTAFAGESVRLRFRVATDGSSGAPGWDIDDIAVAGLTNTPFSRFVADQAACAPDTPTTTDAPTTSDATSADDPDDASSDDTAEILEPDDGCGCDAGAPATPALLLLGLPLLRRRRRV